MYSQIPRMELREGHDSYDYSGRYWAYVECPREALLTLTGYVVAVLERQVGNNETLPLTGNVSHCSLLKIAWCGVCGTRLYFYVVPFTLFTLRRQIQDQNSYCQSRTSLQKCALRVVSLTLPLIAFAWREGHGRLSVGCLGVWLVWHRISSLITSGSNVSGLVSVKPVNSHPENPLLREPSTAVGQVFCESVIRCVHRVSLSN